MKLTFTTSYAENWRYSVMITLSMRDSAGNQVGYRSVEDTPLPIGSADIAAPEGWVRRREVSVEFDPCHSVRFYLYLLPSVLPETTTLAGVENTFKAKVVITDGDKELFCDRPLINCFGGCGKDYIVNFEN